jgi:hypothetical protein
MMADLSGHAACETPTQITVRTAPYRWRRAPDIAATGRDFALSTLFCQALLDSDAWIFGLRSITPHSGFLFAKQSYV